MDGRNRYHRLYIWTSHALRDCKRSPEILLFLDVHTALLEDNVRKNGLEMVVRMKLISAQNRKHEADAMAVFECLKVMARQGLCAENVNLLLDLAMEHLECSLEMPKNAETMNVALFVLDLVEHLMMTQAQGLEQLMRLNDDRKNKMEAVMTDLYAKSVNIFWQQYCRSANNADSTDHEMHTFCKCAVLDACFSTVGMMKDLPKKILKMCFNNISQRKSPYLGLEMVRELIEMCTLPTQHHEIDLSSSDIAAIRSNRSTVTQILHEIDEEGVDALVEEAPESSTREKHSKIGILDTIISLIVDRAYFTNTDVQRWNCLLNMLKFLPLECHEGTLISLKHVKQLWEAFVLRTNESLNYPECAERHLEDVMQFLSIVIRDRSISIEACQFALERYNAGDIPFGELAHYHYNCFSDLYDSAQDMGFLDAEGIKTFWKICIYATKVEVWQTAALRLCTMHVGSLSARHEFVGDLFRPYAESCS